MNYYPTDSINRSALDKLIALGSADRSYEIMCAACVEHFDALTPAEQAATSVEHLVKMAQASIAAHEASECVLRYRELAAAIDALDNAEIAAQLHQHLTAATNGADRAAAEKGRLRDLQASCGSDPGWDF